MVLGVGVALVLLSLVLWVTAALVIALALRRATNEERLFLKSMVLGYGYSEYVERTGRFVPTEGPIRWAPDEFHRQFRTDERPPLKGDGYGSSGQPKSCDTNDTCLGPGPQNPVLIRRSSW